MTGVLETVALGALGNVIADGIAAAGAHRHNRRNPERLALGAVAARALSAAFSDALRDDVSAPPEWIDAVAAQWQPAFSHEVVDRLLSVIAAPSSDNQRRFDEVTRTALELGFVVRTAVGAPDVAAARLALYRATGRSMPPRHRRPAATASRSTAAAQTSGAEQMFRLRCCSGYLATRNTR